MVKTEKLPDTDIYRYEIHGSVDETSMQHLTTALESGSNRQPRMLFVMSEMPKFESLSAFTKAIKAKGEALQQGGRYAFLSNQKWLARLVPVGNFLSPGIPVRHFHLNEETEAVEWLKQKDEEQAPTFHAAIELRDEGHHVYSFTVHGTFTNAAMDRLYHLIKDRSGDGRLSLLGDLREFEGFESFYTILKGAKADVALFSHAKKVALLIEPGWMDTAIGIGDFLTPGVDIKAFPGGSREEALAWLKRIV